MTNTIPALNSASQHDVSAIAAAIEAGRITSIVVMGITVTFLNAQSYPVLSIEIGKIPPLDWLHDAFFPYPVLLPPVVVVGADGTARPAPTYK